MIFNIFMKCSDMIDNGIFSTSNEKFTIRINEFYNGEQYRVHYEDSKHRIKFSIHRVNNSLQYHDLFTSIQEI